VVGYFYFLTFYFFLDWECLVPIDLSSFQSQSGLGGRYVSEPNGD